MPMVDWTRYREKSRLPDRGSLLAIYVQILPRTSKVAHLEFPGIRE